MLCANCSRLSFQYTKKKCLRCQADVIISLAVICEACSLNNKICAICSKKLQNANTSRGCGCHGK